MEVKQGSLHTAPSLMVNKDMELKKKKKIEKSVRYVERSEVLNIVLFFKFQKMWFFLWKNEGLKEQC